MAAFTSEDALAIQRDSLRQEIKKLQSIVAIASDWVEALERDRLPIPELSELEYDASVLTTAQNLLVQLRAETSTTSTAGLNLRVKNTLSIKAYDPLTKGPL